jgi:hypothetical protein
VAVLSFSSETWASTSPDNGEALSNDVSKLTAAADGSQLAIHGNIVFAGTVFPAGPLSERVSHSSTYAASSMHAILGTAPPKAFR